MKVVQTALSNYETLRRQVRETLLLGQARIEREKIRTYWQTGKLINDFVLQGGRAERNKEVISRLARDLQVSDRLLYETVQFARTFPYSRLGANITWSHYRRLATVPDEKKRLQLLKQAETHEWTAEKLQKIVSNTLTLEFKEKSQNTDAKLLTQPVLGPFWTYKIIRPEVIHSKSNELLLDLGFSITVELDKFGNKKFEAGTVVNSIKNKDGSSDGGVPRSRATVLESLRLKGEYSIEKSKDQDPNRLFTYRAFVERVIDADTFKVEIDLGFNIRIRETIRLRGIDAFEIDGDDEVVTKPRGTVPAHRRRCTTPGKRAKAFVERSLSNEPFVILKSTKDDKYGRYLGDIFYSGLSFPRKRESANQNAVIARTSEARTKQSSNLRYLNQELLDRKFAVRM